MRDKITLAFIIATAIVNLVTIAINQATISQLQSISAEFGE